MGKCGCMGMGACMGCVMVRTGVRIADSAARGDSETAKMKEERLAKEAVDGTGIVKVGRDIKKTWNKAFAGERSDIEERSRSLLRGAKRRCCRLNRCFLLLTFARRFPFARRRRSGLQAE